MEGVRKKNEDFEELAKEMFLPSLHMPVALLWRVTQVQDSLLCKRGTEENPKLFLFMSHYPWECLERY